MINGSKLQKRIEEKQKKKKALAFSNGLSCVLQIGLWYAMGFNGLNEYTLQKLKHYLKVLA